MDVISGGAMAMTSGSVAKRRCNRITAAVVGVIANLATVLTLHALFDETRRVDGGPVHLNLPVLSSGDPFAVSLTVVALGLAVMRGWGPLRVLGLCGAVGLVHAMVNSV